MPPTPKSLPGRSRSATSRPGKARTSKSRSVRLPTISPLVLGFLRWIARRRFQKHFRAVRVSGAERLARFQSGALPGPLLVYANHASWWDPLVSILLAHRLLPTRRHYAPMDAEALERYAILKRIGVFGVDMHSVRGAAQFLRTGLNLLLAHGVLWITPQGRFADVRERPIVFKPGLAALAARVPGGCTVFPMAIEYVFWDERLPEVLLEFGEPITVPPGIAADLLEEQMHTALLGLMDRLRDKSIRRDPALFDVLLEGRTGSGGFYQYIERLHARLVGRPYHPDHTVRPGADATATARSVSGELFSQAPPERQA